MPSKASPSHQVSGLAGVGRKHLGLDFQAV
jgi:hypothetical protein